MSQTSLDEKCINTIRCLAMDAVQKANSGHPGTPMALAPAAYALWTQHLKFNPANPHWFNRDRFVLSCGHASMLQYAVLHLTGYGISIDDIKNFRQWESNTPGHPEYGRTPGIETTTGPLGQGIMTSVGMAMAEAHLAAVFNTIDTKIVDHHTYAFCSDGDMMEGASHEAASLAGHLGLGKLIWLYDDNHISIEGNTSLTYSDNVTERFEAYHWQVINLGDMGNDLDAINGAFTKAKAEKEKPTLIILRTHIGYGSPNKQDTPKAHGSPLGEEEIKLTKKFYGWPENEKFLVPADVKKEMLKAVSQGKKEEAEWDKIITQYKKKSPDLYAQFQQYLKNELTEDWDDEMPAYKPADGPKATRSVTSDFLNAVAARLPWLIGGSADLEPSTETLIKSSAYIAKDKFDGRNLAWGIREHVMCAASSGITIHGGLRAYAATFFVFTDYARAAIRLACIMKQPVIYVMTHDSIGLGEDGTTHQPIEHLASLRAMPDLHVIRPADANEAAYAWRNAITRTDGPTMLVLSRQKLPIFDEEKVAHARNLNKGAYVLSPSKKKKPDVILIATGSEVHLILDAQKRLEKSGISASVVSMPSWELFRAQPPKYKESVLPAAIKVRVAVETAASFGWHEWVGDSGKIIALDRFGESAPDKVLFEHFGFTVENVVNTVKKMIKKKK
jgi:transketolase